MARGGVGHEHRQDTIRAAHGFPALEYVRPDRARYEGNRAVRKLSCAAQYQIMAFA